MSRFFFCKIYILLFALSNTNLLHANALSVFGKFASESIQEVGCQLPLVGGVVQKCYPNLSQRDKLAYAAKRVVWLGAAVAAGLIVFVSSELSKLYPHKFKTISNAAQNAIVTIVGLAGGEVSKAIDKVVSELTDEEVEETLEIINLWWIRTFHLHLGLL